VALARRLRATALLLAALALAEGGRASADGVPASAPRAAEADATWLGPDGKPRRAYRPRFRPAEELRSNLALLGVGGASVALDGQRDRLVLAGAEADLATSAEALEFLDVAPGQVLVEALLAECVVRDDRERGGHALFDRTAAGGADTVFRSVSYTFEPEAWLRSQLVADRPFEGSSVAFGADAEETSLAGAFETVLRALHEEGRAELLAAPCVLCTEGVPARVSSTLHLPIAMFSKGADGVAKRQFSAEKAGVSLEVVAERVGTDRVTLRVHPWVRLVARAKAEAGPTDVPVLAVREAETTLVVADRETALVGGLGARRRVRARQGLPWLARLPALEGGLGRLDAEDEVEELVLLVRATVVVPGRAPAAWAPPSEAERLARRPARSRARLVGEGEPGATSPRSPRAP
jgi:general secretion pathway protein D